MPIKARDSMGRILAVRASRMLDGVCAVCGATFRYDPVYISGKTCGRKCNGVLIGKQRAHKLKKPPDVKSCVVCGKEFKTYHRHHRHCSRSCSNKTAKDFAGGRKDQNHDEIVRCLIARGFLVQDTHLVGRGYPDLRVQKEGITYFVEVKNPKWRHQYGLTPMQKKFFKEFLVHIVCNEGDVEELARVQERDRKAMLSCEVYIRSQDGIR